MRRLSLYNIFIIALIRGKVKPFLLYNNKERKGQSQRLSTPWLWFDDAKGVINRVHFPVVHATRGGV